MNRFTLLAAIAAAALSFGAAAVATAQESPTPQPTGTTAPTICTGAGQRGGETLQTINGASVTPPGGGTFILTISTPGTQDAPFSVCFVEGNARVTISSNDCDEISRDNPDDDPGADFVLDLIVDSCELTAPTATPAPPSQGDDDDDTVTATPTATAGSISPPSTGDAGLR